MTDQEGVQAANTTETRRRSVTELARIAATGRGWRGLLNILTVATVLEVEPAEFLAGLVRLPRLE